MRAQESLRASFIEQSPSYVVPKDATGSYFWKFVCLNTNEPVNPVSTAAGLKVPFSMALNSLLLQWSQQRAAVVVLGSSQVWLCGAGWIWSRVVLQIKRQLTGPPHKYQNKQTKEKETAARWGKWQNSGEGWIDWKAVGGWVDELIGWRD